MANKIIIHIGKLKIVMENSGDKMDISDYKKLRKMVQENVVFN